MILVDTGVVLALLDVDDAWHGRVRELYERTGDRWVLPWAILPEVDYLVSRHGGAAPAMAFRRDLAEGAWFVAWGDVGDLSHAYRFLEGYGDLALGLVDAVVLAMAERLEVEAIATLDLRHFGAVRIRGSPPLLPRDG